MEPRHSALPQYVHTHPSRYDSQWLPEVTEVVQSAQPLIDRVGVQVASAMTPLARCAANRDLIELGTQIKRVMRRFRNSPREPDRKALFVLLYRVNSLRRTLRQCAVEQDD